MRLKFASDFKIKRFNNKAIGKLVLLRANRFLYAAGQKKPYTKIEFVVKEVGVSRPTAMSYHNQLIRDIQLMASNALRENG